MAVKIALETDPRTRWFAVLLGPAGQVSGARAGATGAGEAEGRDKQASA
jgi:hypothetical protein